MNKPTIGIRQADGSFYAIMEDSGTPRKRLVLSAARADQHSVKIDLYRSTDGEIDDSTLVGTLDLLSDETLEFQDITFDISIDDTAQLSATATLAGGNSSSIDVDLSEFRSEKRSDADILADDEFDSAELDSLDDAFGGSAEEPESSIPEDGETVPMDLPEMGELETDEMTLDSLDEPDLALDEPEPSLDLPDLSLDDAPAADEASADFDMDDLDAGFSVPDLNEPGAEDAAAEDAAPAGDDESWHDFSMDDMEPMEFLDTGDQISAPKPKAPTAPADDDEFSMDDAPLDLDSDLDSAMEMEELADLGDEMGAESAELDSMPDFGSDDAGAGFDSSDGLDEDFLPPPELSDDKAYASSKAEKKAAQKPEKRPKAKPAQAVKPAKPAPASGGAFDKTSLVLSLVSLSLLVVTIIVLLFLNMIRPPQTPVIQPEVMQWKGGAATTQATTSSGPIGPIDLGADNLPSFAASTVAEVPAALKGVAVTLRLKRGETVADATRRFGAPQRVEGDLLSW